jgi:hypothetical protein
MAKFSLSALRAKLFRAAYVGQVRIFAPFASRNVPGNRHFSKCSPDMGAVVAFA